jgi:hypothetical protein
VCYASAVLMSSYGLDREHAHHFTQASSPVPRDSSSTKGDPSRPLIHHEDSTESLDNPSAFAPHLLPPGSPLRPDADIELNVNNERRRSSQSHRRGSKQSIGPVADKVVENHAATDDKMFFGMEHDVGVPPKMPDSRGGDGDTVETERTSLRASWEANGWLPGPSPGKLTRIRRRRAV